MIPLFLKQPPILPTLPFLWEKSDAPPLFRKFRKLKVHHYKGEGWFQLCFIVNFEHISHFEQVSVCWEEYNSILNYSLI